MQVPPEITLKGVDMTPDIDKMITRGLAKLEQTCDYIIGTRIAVEQIQGRHRTGNPYQMRIDIIIPDRPEIVVKRTSRASQKPPDSSAQSQIETALSAESETESAPVGRSPSRKKAEKEEPVVALIRRTFDSAERELGKMVDKQRGAVKNHTQQQTTAVVQKIFRDQDYGFLRTTDSQQQVYFNKNSVLHNHWESLTVGTIVRYTPEDGEKGLQASTVELINKPGVAELHDELHDLPTLSQPVRSRKPRSK